MAKKTKLKDYDRFTAVRDEMAHVRRAPNYSSTVSAEAGNRGKNGRKRK